MSRIDELLAELAPNGIQRKALQDVTEVRSGWGFPNEEQGSQHGHYPFYKVSDMNLPGNELVMSRANNYIDASVARRLGVSPAPAGTVIFPKIGAAVATNKKRILSTTSAYDNNVMGLLPDKALEPRFLLYWMQTIDLAGISNDSGAVPSIRKSEMQAVRIPVPPLEVQREIVRVLDQFTQLEAELEAKLEAELEARRRQYAYYRNHLLDFREAGGIRWVPMGEVGKFVRGRRFTRADVVDSGIPSIHYGEIYTHYGTSASTALQHVRNEIGGRLRYAKQDDVVIAAVGETVEDVGKAVAWLGAEQVAIHDDTFLFRSDLNPTFVAYVMQTGRFQAQKNQHVSRAKMKRLSSDGLGKIKIPTPTRNEQDRVVGIIEKFDALVNDLSIGLPAELAARRKQYEHYRDRLLTFEEMAA